MTDVEAEPADDGEDAEVVVEMEDDAGDVGDDAEASAQKWYELFHGFVAHHMPSIGYFEVGEEIGAAATYTEVPADVEKAREAAVITTLAAMESMAARFIQPAVVIDVSKAGRG